jgi:DNA-directed RNA polymerase
MSLIPEQKMKSMGAARHIMRLAKARHRQQAASVQGGERAVLRVVVPKLAELVEARCALSDHTPGPNAAAHAHLGLLRPEIVAYIAVRSLMDALGKRAPLLTSVAGIIGRRVEAEVRFKHIKKSTPWLYKWAMEQVKHTSHARHRHRVLKHVFDRADEHTGKWAAWTTRQHVTLGAWLIDALAQAEDPIITIEYVQPEGKKRKCHAILPTPTLLAAIAELEQRACHLEPWYQPITVVPKAWDETLEGGYHTLPKSKFVKRKFASANDVDLKASDLTHTFNAVNALQATAWRVNRDVLDVALHFWKSRVDIGGMGNWVAEPRPARPEGVPLDVPIRALPVAQRKAMRRWTRELLEHRTREMMRGVSMIADSHQLVIAGMYRDEPRLYYPHQLDFRGRMYPSTYYLQPQGCDLERGLLHFAEGKEVGVDGGWWLGVHGANVYGLDKVGLNARVDWALHPDTLDLVHSIAADPYYDTRWSDADKPFQFLAWCLEWSAFVKAGEPVDFRSRLPVAMDGSCNGLQHFAAMMRDEAGGAAVNLVPSSEPQDVYDRVSARLIQRLEAAAPDNKIAREWLAAGLVDRKLVKRQVMTVPYGVTKFGMRAQLKGAVLERICQQAPPFEDLPEATAYLNEELWESIGDVVLCAKAAMTFLQGCVRAVRGKVRWTTPAELVIQQEYQGMSSGRVRTVLLGGCQLRLREPTNRLDPRKQVAAVSPNFVHSLDAAHLTLTIDLMGDGISWAMVHDSYGCHAGDAQALASALRVAFVTMYSDHDVLAEFRAQVAADHPGVELPELPAKGGLDIGEVLRAEFFFN